MDCPHIPDLGYGEFARRLRGKLAGQRIPLSGSLELTLRCNLRCVHCYVAHAPEARAGQAELTSREIDTILGQVMDEGCLWLLLTGGEPLLRPDWTEIYLSAKKRGFVATLFTNGTLLTPPLADLLAEWRPFAVEITLYGRTQETYERVTGVPGSFARCMRGIELLLERDVPLRLKTMAMTLNKHELGDIKAYAESLGVSYRFDPMMNGGLVDRSPLAYRLSPEEVVALDLADAKRMEGWRTFFDRFVGPPESPEFLYTCGAGFDTFHIDPYGQLSACMLAREPHYDLRRGSFRQGWREFIGEVRQQKRTKDIECAHCELLSLCGQCPGWAQLEHGQQEQKVDYLCEVAHLRASVFRFADSMQGEGKT